MNTGQQQETGQRGGDQNRAAEAMSQKELVGLHVLTDSGGPLVSCVRIWGNTVNKQTPQTGCRV